MGCPPVRGDNPRALAGGLSYVQVDKHGITIYTTYISVDLAHHKIFRVKVGKGGINMCKAKSSRIYLLDKMKMQSLHFGTSFSASCVEQDFIFCMAFMFLFCLIDLSLRPINNLSVI